MLFSLDCLNIDKQLTASFTSGMPKHVNVLLRHQKRESALTRSGSASFCELRPPRRTSNSPPDSHSTSPRNLAIMTKWASMFRPKKLDLSGFVNTRLIRDNNKRKAFEKTEPDRSVTLSPAPTLTPNPMSDSTMIIGKHFATSSAIPASPSEFVHRPSWSCHKCTPTLAQHRLRTVALHQALLAV